MSVSSTFTERYIDVMLTKAVLGLGPTSLVTWYFLNPFILRLLLLMLPPPLPPQSVSMEDMHMKGGKNWTLREEVDIGFFCLFLEQKAPARSCSD